MRKLTLSFSMIAFSTLAAAPAVAEEPPDTARTGYGYRFDDDSLIGQALDGTIPRIQVRKGPTRVTLIRPRTQFVQELFKSAEKL
jgi:hypothetical protein